MSSIKDIKILLGPSTFSDKDPAPMERLKESGAIIIDNPYKRKLTKDELLKLLGRDVFGLIAGLEPLDREVMEKSGLKVISRCGSGMSNVDQEAAEEFGIKVYNTPFGPTRAVAELCFMNMLALLRMVPRMNQDLHEGKWNKKTGFQVQGKAVAIIGFGKIGRCLAEMLVPFKAKIIAVDPISKQTMDGVEFQTLEQALSNADIIALHSSGEDPILTRDAFKLMKKGVYILNAARGGLIDEGELIKALDSGQVAGAWLDTFVREPYDGPLTGYPQVILTPHAGSYTVECRREMEMESVDNLIQGFKELGK
ncbi:MAG: phosphoglycerate dehydrogenase [bacterium]